MSRVMKCAIELMWLGPRQSLIKGKKYWGLEM